ncbi:MAG TPA: biopolymer transporter ExbD [Kiritimatiellia bacterium]|nr:biopolymer transporter ExbD [Kiritimatiellia bacterium]HRZ12919.1 biopolymer transporter ExbD [Kiritimatiellia bacterium]HSA18471.1 biopolymer transporter ExbD [Kiritimatiellia bacterium]
MSPSFQPEIERLSTLRRRFRTRLRPATGPMATVPLLNVFLLLWLFHIVNSAFVLQPGIRMQLPAAPFTAGAHYGTRVVTLTQEGQIFFEDERVSLAELPAALAKAVGRTPSPLLIEADGRVRHQVLVHIYAMATEAGFREVLLATRLPERTAEAP